MNETDEAGAAYDVVVVGGGFSGVMVAINIAQASRSLRIAIVERKDELGSGVAYAGTPRDALLNVPAGAMGAFPDQPDDFANWLRSLAPKAAADVDPGAYYPRHIYGAYIASLLSDAERAGHDLTTIQANVVAVERQQGGIMLVAHDGRTVACGHQVVFALGGPPPADIVSGMGDVRDDPRYVRDPWVFLKRQAFATRGEIVVVGSGLTALDVISAFAKTGCTNPLTVLSRGGRFPLPHGTPGAAAIDPIPVGCRPTSIRTIVAIVREAIRRAAADGHDWRCVIDGLRPRIAELWLGLDQAERRRFLRHVRPIYDPHRHRAPRQVLATKDRLAAAGQLRSLAGRIVALEPRADAIEVTVRARGDGREHTIAAAQIVNCGGPGNAYATSTDPLVAHLLARGEVACHSSGLGLEATVKGRLIDNRGMPHRDLYTIGWPMRGVLFETTAVRELRAQARILADEVIASVPLVARAAAADVA